MRKWLIIGGVGVLVLVLGLVIGLNVFTKHFGRMTVEEAVYFVGNHLKVEYDEKSDNPAAGTQKYRGIRIRPKIFSRFGLNIDECVLAITPGPGPRDLPQRLKARLSGIRPVNPKELEYLAALGYEDFLLDADLDLEVWPEKKRITVRELNLHGAEAGSLFGYLVLNEIEVTLDTPLSEALEKLNRSFLALVELEYEDDSLINRLVQAAARKEGKSPEEVLGKTVADIRQKARNEKDAVKAEAMMVLAEFIRNPGKISVRARPPEPVSVGKIREHKKISEGEWPEELNLVISTE